MLIRTYFSAKTAVCPVPENGNETQISLGETSQK